MVQQKNKKVDLGSTIDGFMQRVENNISVEPTRKEEVRDGAEKVRTEDAANGRGEVHGVPIKMGRPVKSTTLVCDKMKSFRFDKDTCRKLEGVRYYEGISMQDFVYVAVEKMLKEYNSDKDYVASYVKNRIRELFKRDCER